MARIFRGFMKINDFINVNKKMWKSFQNNEIKEKLLVESPQDKYMFIVHCMAMQTLILNKARGMQPLWIKNEKVPIELLKSYVPSAEYIDLERLKTIEKIYMRFCIFVQYIKILLTGNALNFKFAGIKYGDILHDTYLAIYQQGTLQRPNSKLKKIMKEIIMLHMQYAKTIKKHNISAILSSHRVSYCACLVRAALLNNCKVYTNSGMHRNTLHVSQGVDELIEYEYAPSKEQIKQIYELPEEIFNEEYKSIKNEHLFGNVNRDAKYAFSDENILFENKKDFCEKYNLDINKKNVFVMLHAFTDHPHSHFKGMIFKDYGDWFLKTLDFAKKNKNVNWIFKQHPSDKFYPTKDINFGKLFENIPDNILFLSTDDKVDTRSLENIADAIVTCLGSAGFEIPAFCAVPSITAGDNHYAGFSFSKNPKNKKEYFNILKTLDKVEKLPPEAQKEARAVYMFIYKYCTVDYKFNPVLTQEEIHQMDVPEKFFDRVKTIYEQIGDELQSEVARYSFEVSRKDFKALRSKDFVKYEDYLSFPFDITKPMPECRYDVMKEGCQILDGLNISYVLSDGTLLGLYRDGELIPHDTDIDVAVVLPTDTGSIIREFIKHDFSIGRFVLAYGQVRQIVFYKNETLFDIIFYQKVGDKVLAFNEKDFYFMHNANHYKNTSKLNCNGYAFSIPNDTEGWLAYVYGNDWKQPKPKPKNWREDVSMHAHPYDGNSYEIIMQYWRK